MYSDVLSNQSWCRSFNFAAGIRVGKEAGALAQAAMISAVTFFILFGLTLEARSAGETGWHWQVERVSGRVIVETKSGEKFVAERGMQVRKGWKVKTGRGRIAISRGEENFVLSPRSVVTLEPKGFLIKRTVIYQDRGQVEVNVRRRWYRHFKVETPFLAAVVKGTQFKVKVQQNGATINVERGVVNVHDFASGDRADVAAGQSARTNPSRRVGLSVGGKNKPEIYSGPKRAPAFQTRVTKNVPATPAAARSANNQGRASGVGANSSRANGNGNSGNGNSGNGNSGNSNSGNSNSGNGNSGNGNSGNSNDNGNSGNGNGNSGNGSGNGNSGNGNSGNGNGNGNSGNGNGNGNGNSGNGNGNGNSGNGNGNGKK